MALLTADDVHWKQFTATKFREGYDQEEVDEFLDQVVETIATMQEQNDSLKGQLDETRQAVANGEPLPAIPDSEAVQKLQAELEAERERSNSLQGQLEAVANVPEGGAQDEAVAQLQQQLAAVKAENESLRGELEQAKSSAAASPSKAPEDATSMLALAQRVHDEYVRNGQEEAQKIISDSREEGQRIVSEAHSERDRVREELSGIRNELESKIDELKSFEANYRAQVRAHLEGLLEQVHE